MEISRQVERNDAAGSPSADQEFVPPGHEDHDRLLILSMLARTPAERLRVVEGFLRGIAELRRGRVL